MTNNEQDKMTWYKLVIIIINEIITVCYVTLILTIIVLVYPSLIGARDKLVQKHYTPKQKRGPIGKITKLITNRYIPRIFDKIERWSERLKVKNRDNRKKSSIRLIDYQKTRYYSASRIAMSVLAMSTGEYRYNHYREQRIAHFDTDAEAIGIDNRCSACISHRIEDFIDNPVESKRTIKGFGGTKVENIMRGTIKWEWLDDEGKKHRFIIPNSYYVPSGSVRLLSPQHWAQTQLRNNVKKGNDIGCDTKHDRIILYWNRRENRITVPISKVNNVATFFLSPGYNKYKLFCKQAEINEVEEIEDPMYCMPAKLEDQDLLEEGIGNKGSKTLNWPTGRQVERSKFDIDMGERPAHGTTSTDRRTIDRESNTAELLELHQRYGHVSFNRIIEMSKQGIISRKFSNCRIPVCSTCMFAKASRRRWRDKPNQRENSVQTLLPGDKISVDQLVSPTPGLVAQMTGKLTTKRYKYVTVFVDQSSRLGFVHLQSSADADETILAKRAFEEYSRQQGITHISAYHADNGVFRAKKWVESCRRQGQNLSFAGVNAHHQNGIAERRIKEIQGLARAMLIHANRRWPEAITPNLWPYAIKMANEVLNDTPNMLDPERRSAVQIFSRAKVHHNSKHQKTFGCPVYVLDNSLQQNGIFHKWNIRSRVGIYLGKSPQHAKNVSLVLNRNTGLVSPQFHVVHDNNFDTVRQEKYESSWQWKAGFVNQRAKRKSNEMNNSNGEGRMHSSQYKDMMGRPAMDHAQRTIREESNKKRDERRKRRNMMRDRFIMGETEGVSISPDSEGVTEPVINDAIVDDEELTKEIFSFEALFPHEEPEILDPLLAYKAVADPDVMYLHQAMKEHDKEKFIEAMRKEIRDQSQNGNFTIMNRNELPKGKRVMKTVWQMRRKRDIKSRAVKKYKARLNVDGSRMIRGVDYDETYSPVATWRTIRLIMTLAAQNGWHTRQLDYVLAFPQAPVERELYMEIPKGFNIDEGRTDDFILKINKNIYGQKQAGRVWNKYLVNKLIKELGFKQSSIDECLFYKGNVLYALYTDDSILTGPDKGEIDKIIADMRRIGLNITDEGNLEDFLGVNIERKEDGSIVLTQPHLIDQILKDLRLDNDKVKEKDTPAASSKILSAEPSEEEFDKSFHYRSVIGKLNYLEKSTRPDIAYATHQCARFTESPRKSHGKAVRWIARYLKKTRTKGVIMRPIPDKDLELFVDADFAGNWKRNESNNRENARSRHGYFIMYKDCPIMWKSQLQGEIALSSTESEYIGISHGLRDVIPIMETLKEMKNHGVPIGRTKSTVQCRVFEDNSGAIEMAKVHKYRPRTKHVNVKYHHFRDYVTRGEVSIHPIKTTDQPADMLTKPVSLAILRKLRLRMMGW